LGLTKLNFPDWDVIVSAVHRVQAWCPRSRGSIPHSS